MRKGLFHFFLRDGELLLKILQLLLGFNQLFFYARQRIVDPLNITKSIFADLNRIAALALNRQKVTLSKTVETDCQSKAMIISADLAVCTQGFHYSTSLNESCTGQLFVGVLLTANCHQKMIFVSSQDRLRSGEVGFEASNSLLDCSNLNRICPGNISFEPVSVAGVVRFQQLQFAHLNIQIHLFLDVWISGCQCFDFSVRKSGIINIFTGAHR